MKKYNVTVPSSDSKNLLNTVVWEPDEGAKAVLQLVHGMAEHIERYRAILRSISQITAT